MQRPLNAMALTLSLSITSLSLAAPPSIDDYIGKWDLTLVDSGTSFRACCLVVSKKGDAATAEVVWRWASPHRDLKVELGEKGELLVHNSGLWKEPLRLRLVGGELEGKSIERNDQQFTVHGTRSVHKVDMTGVWDMTAQKATGETATGRLELVGLGAGRVAAKAYNSDGDSIDVKDVKTSGAKLSLALMLDDGDVALRARIVGDRLVGSATLPDGTEVGLSGRRRRRFGPAVNLIAANGTSGWHARDESREFRWTCKDGVLQNGDHDVDIVSNAKFDDFKLELEYKVDRPGANSGIYLRGRYEVQILGNDRLSDHSNGAVYGRLKPKANPFSGVGKWQKVEITLIDRHVTVVMNGTTVQDNARLEAITGGALNSQEHEPGPIMLQGDHGKIYFRNVKVYPALP